MKATPEVKAGIQDAMTIEASLMLQYFADERDVNRLGLDLASGLKQLSGQCQDHLKELTSRLLFREGAPALDPRPAATHNDLGAIISDAIAAETAAVERFADLCKQSFADGDMSMFHFYQHLAKWHCEGDDKFKGHLLWLQQQAALFKALGESGYIAMSAVKN